jgi:hypothetical protein
MRKGLTLIEAVAASALLATLSIAVLDMIMENGHATALCTRRIVLELRARRLQAEDATTTYDTLVSASDLPAALSDALDGVKHENAVGEVRPGLAEARTCVTWEGRHVESIRLIADPARSLR